MEALEEQLEELEKYQLVLVSAKIKALKNEASHRLRVLDHTCAELLLKAVQDDEEVAVQYSQTNDLNLNTDDVIIFTEQDKKRSKY